MKAIAKALLILASFTLLHEILHLVFTHAANAYELSQPHCGCTRPQPWIILLIRVTDFFFEWPIGNTLLSDLIWGSVATALYLWIGKRRKAKRLTRQASVDAPVGVWPPAPRML